MYVCLCGHSILHVVTSYRYVCGMLFVYATRRDNQDCKQVKKYAVGRICYHKPGQIIRIYSSHELCSNTHLLYNHLSESLPVVQDVIEPSLLFGPSRKGKATVTFHENFQNNRAAFKLFPVCTSTLCAFISFMFVQFSYSLNTPIKRLLQNFDLTQHDMRFTVLCSIGSWTTEPPWYRVCGG